MEALVPFNLGAVVAKQDQQIQQQSLDWIYRSIFKLAKQFWYCKVPLPEKTVCSIFDLLIVTKPKSVWSQSHLLIQSTSSAMNQFIFQFLTDLLLLLLIYLWGPPTNPILIGIFCWEGSQSGKMRCTTTGHRNVPNGELESSFGSGLEATRRNWRRNGNPIFLYLGHSGQSGRFL